jgi:hypothetical protein
LVTVVSRSSFLLLLFTVASLTAAAGVQSGGGRAGKPEWRYEAHADVASLRDDFYSFRSEAERAPSEIGYFIGDVVLDCRFLAADFRSEARIAVRYLASFLHSETGAAGGASPADHT